MRFKVDIPETTIMRHEIEGAFDEEHAISLALEGNGNPYPVNVILDETAITVETEALYLVDYRAGLLKPHRRILV